MRTRATRERGTDGRRGGKPGARGTSPYPPPLGNTADPGTPEAHGLYDPALDKDACGVGFIADIKGRKSQQIVKDALTILVNLEHRGAVGADPRAGDGAGILVQIPHKFFARKAKALGITLPAPGEYGIGALFMPRDAERRALVCK